MTPRRDRQCIGDGVRAKGRDRPLEPPAVAGLAQEEGAPVVAGGDHAARSETTTSGAGRRPRTPENVLTPAASPETEALRDDLRPCETPRDQSNEANAASAPREALTFSSVGARRSWKPSWDIGRGGWRENPRRSGPSRRRLIGAPVARGPRTRASLRCSRHPCGVARADLLVHLVRAARERDDGELRRTVESVIAEERDKQHHLLAERLEEALRSSTPANGDERGSAAHGFGVVTPRFRLDDLVLPEKTREAVEELIEEQQRTDVLRAYGLEPRHRLLLLGPPGNGKTSLAEAIAEALLLPLVVVRYEEVIGSYLGETAARLASVFSFARTRRCVLFFDEFDAVAKERGDEHETGEIKRVVSSLLLQVDALPSHAVIVAASNHQELLDRAVHRRFELRLELPLPGKAARIAWFERLLATFDEPVGMTPETLGRKTAGASFSQLQDLADDVRRRRVLEPGTSLRRLVPQRIAIWRDVCALETHA